MTLFALKLILAHLLGDFLLQPTKWVTDKERLRIKSPYQYVHVLVHGILTLFLLKFNLHYWGAILLVMVLHYLIDITKLYIQTNSNKRWMFFADQFAHMLSIALVVRIYFPYQLDFSILLSVPVLILICFIIFISSVTGILMTQIIARWRMGNWLPDELPENEGLQKAGKYIGILERLFVFGFIALGHWEGVGFLLAAKSIFRFGDLSKARDRKLTEYILIGTLLSFGIAILSGVAYNYLLVHLPG